MKTYNDAIALIRDTGVESEDRTGTGTIKLAGLQMRFDLAKGFPAVTTKKLAFKAVVTELLWFLRGSTDNRALSSLVHDGNATGATIWSGNASDPNFTRRAYDGDLGPVYGHQWRFWPADGTDFHHVDRIPASEATRVEMPTKGFKPKSDTSAPQIHALWIHIMGECARNTAVSISNDWQDYLKFKEEVIHLPGFYRFMTDSMYTLDPNYYGANQYSKETSIFVRGDKLSRTLDLLNSSKNTPSSVYRPIWFIDQISELIHGLKTNPTGRRHIITAWNVSDLSKMALPPCHCLASFVVLGNKLTCVLTQRSCDMFLGVPFNIASYSLLTHMIAKECGMEVGELVWNGGDCHIYKNHLPQVEEQLNREPFKLPELMIKHDRGIFDYQLSDFDLLNYQHHPAIKADMAV